MTDFTFANMDDDLFEVILQQAVKKSVQNEIDTLPPDEELRKMYTFSERHNKRMKKLFAAEKRRGTHIAVIKWCKLAAATVCIITTVFFGALLISSEVRAAVRGTIVRFFEGFAQVEFVESETPITIDRVATDFELGFIPDGYGLISSDELEHGIFNMFGDSEGNLLIWSINTIDSAPAVDTDHADYRSETREGIEYHIFESQSEDYFSVIVWTQGGFVFSLTGLLDIDEFMKMAISVSPFD